MSFGAPGGGATSTKPTPPERGSFPLDHDGTTLSPHALNVRRLDAKHDGVRAIGGECKDVMMSYLSCIKRTKGLNDPECRLQAKENLMAKDEFKNLGFGEEKGNEKGKRVVEPKKEEEKGVKGELRW
ncbi:hypothetical protein BKA64DRAFT_707110 [Cadophora sp. MPI-SDFR-AT-0126]|nr:hypothetical protein BKA64DRAFT_707110 [Leotiomycetes sp. MPI-SDFR-AT-0126]